MRKKTGKETNRRFFKKFCVMLLIFALVIPCMDGIITRVHATDTAEVWKIYANISDDEITDLELVADSESVAGKELLGKFITGGNYTLTEEDNYKLIIADNAELTGGNIVVGELKLSGNSRLTYTDYSLSTTVNRFPSYPVTAGAITIEGLQNHYDAEGTPYFVDPDRNIWAMSYDLTVNGNMTIEGFPNRTRKEMYGSVLIGLVIMT